MSRSRKMDMYKESEGGRKWIKGAIGKPGALHRELRVPLDKKIPAGKLHKALHSRSPLERKRANLAKTLESFNH